MSAPGAAVMLITGQPGNGKTLRAIEHINDWLEDGRPVYTNIEGVDIPGHKVVEFDTPSTNDVPFDWRDTPEGSVVVYDEAQRFFRSPGKADPSPPEVITEMETVRHTGRTLVFLTQASNFVHINIRRLCNRHEHVQRNAGLEKAVVFSLDRHFNEADRDERGSADTLIWSYPKKLYGQYSSAVMHVTKKQIPRKLLWLGMLVIAMVAYVGFNAMSAGGLATVASWGDSAVTEARGGSVAVPPTAPAAPRVTSDIERRIGGAVELPWDLQDWTSVAQATPIAGCISTAARCQCFSASGLPLMMPTQECRVRSLEPLPFRIKGSGKQREKKRKDNEGATKSSPLSRG